MSVRFQDGAALEARYIGSTPKPGGLPISVTCWLYFGDDDRPEVGDTWTLWWFGEVGATGDNYLALQARRGTTGIRTAADRRSRAA
ncbi:MAG: hypothetical protein RIE32_05470 [Phycisphaerales bacterium]